jgi:hypothetical protein
MCDICGTSFSQSGSLKKHKECHARPGGGGPVRGLSCPERDRRKPRAEVMRRESRLLKEMRERQGQFSVSTPPGTETDSASQSQQSLIIDDEQSPQFMPRVPISMDNFPPSANAEFINAFVSHLN